MCSHFPAIQQIPRIAHIHQSISPLPPLNPHTHQLLHLTTLTNPLPNPIMDNTTSSPAHPTLIAYLDTALPILAFLLLILTLILFILIPCIYIDEYKQRRRSQAVSDEERRIDGEDKACDEVNEKEPLLAAQSTQDRKRQVVTDLQSCTYGNERSSVPGSGYGATNLRYDFDKGSRLEDTTRTPTESPRKPVIEAIKQVPRYFRRHGIIDAGSGEAA